MNIVRSLLSWSLGRRLVLPGESRNSMMRFSALFLRTKHYLPTSIVSITTNSFVVTFAMRFIFLVRFPKYFAIAQVSCEAFL